MTLKRFMTLVLEIHPEVHELKVTSHFMRTIAYEQVPGENSPEGIHEDGANYIVSAMVVNYENCQEQRVRFLKNGADQYADDLS